jgi:hypothetical protein
MGGPLMAVFTTAHVARKAHKCSRCLRQIKAGEKYVAYAITPNDPDIGNKGWLRGREHLYGLCNQED